MSKVGPRRSPTFVPGDDTSPAPSAARIRPPPMELPLGPIDPASLPRPAARFGSEIEPRRLRAPTGPELLTNPIVRGAIEAAWVDSRPDDPGGRHEEGGWIYMNTRRGELFVHRAARGARAAIDLSAPARYADAVVVGTFHTHPNPTAEGWDTGPSASDVLMDHSRGVPGIVRSDQSYHPYAWERRLSLEGSWAYPGTPERPLR